MAPAAGRVWARSLSMADAPVERTFLCVFCGSSAGVRPAYAEAARQVGAAIAEQGLGLVYGGGRVGLMGEVAAAVLKHGGHVVGVIPEPLALKEVAHQGVQELLVVPGMHERKALMAARSQAFLTLPGGIGTLEEFFEIWTWAALGLHNKPIGILNVDGYFDPLLELVRHAVAERFVRPNHTELLVVSDNPREIVRRLPRHVPPPPGPLWIDESQT
jgi:uncharacterized protein (TIGR00730 family)